MSAIVYDGVRLAADLMVNNGNTSWPYEKIQRVKGAYLVVAFGDFKDSQILRRQFAEYGPTIPQTKYYYTDQATMIYVDTDTGRLYRYTQAGHIVDLGLQKVAFGSGKDFAYGALAVGANATDAVKAALKYSPTCGIGVQTVNVQTGDTAYEEYEV